MEKNFLFFFKQNKRNLCSFLKFVFEFDGIVIKQLILCNLHLCIKFMYNVCFVLKKYLSTFQISNFKVSWITNYWNYFLFVDVLSFGDVYGDFSIDFDASTIFYFFLICGTMIYLDYRN